MWTASPPALEPRSAGRGQKRGATGLQRTQGDEGRGSDIRREVLHSRETYQQHATKCSNRGPSVGSEWSGLPASKEGLRVSATQLVSVERALYEGSDRQPPKDGVPETQLFRAAQSTFALPENLRVKSCAVGSFGELRRKLRFWICSGVTGPQAAQNAHHRTKQKPASLALRQDGAVRRGPLPVRSPVPTPALLSQYCR